MKELIRIKLPSNTEKMNEDEIIIKNLEEYIINNFTNINLSIEKIYRDNNSIIFIINIVSEDIEKIIEEILLVLKNNERSTQFEPLTYEKNINNFKKRYRFSGEHIFLNF